MSYGVFFRNEKEKLTIRLPQNPEKIEFSSELDIEELSVIGLGKISAANDLGLEKIKFETQLPHLVSSLVETSNSFKGPDYYLDKFKKWRKEKVPVRFICSNGITKDKSILVLIKNVDIEEKAAEEGDFYISLELIEYKPYELRELPNNPSLVYKKPTPPRAANPPKPAKQSYVIKSGDTLWGIAQRFLGNGSKWPSIYNINKPPLGGNPNLIYPGQRITIP